MSLLRYLPRFRAAYRALDLLEAAENRSAGEIEAYQLERINRIWTHAIVHVPHYRELRQQLALPERFRTLADFRCVPPVRRMDLKTGPSRFLSENPAPGAWHTSSGSTGSPTRFYREREFHLFALRCRYRMLATWGVDIFDRAAFLWGNAAKHQPGWFGPLARVSRNVEDWLRNRLRLSAYHLARADLQSHLIRLAAFQPASLYAYTTAAYLLAREAQSQPIHCDSLKVCILSAEPAPRELRQAVEQGLRVPTAVEYGATECPIIATQGPDRALRVRADLALVETEPLGDGRYQILLTVLGNASFPLLRYAIGDLTDEPVKIPERGFPLLSNVLGRENDLVMTGTGRILHPLRFNFIFAYNLVEFVRQFRVHQQCDGSLLVTIETLQAIPPAEYARLQRELDDLLEGFRVTIRQVSALPYEERKSRWTTSDLVQGSPSVPVALPHSHLANTPS